MEIDESEGKKFVIDKKIIKKMEKTEKRPNKSQNKNLITIKKYIFFLN